MCRSRVEGGHRGSGPPWKIKSKRVSIEMRPPPPPTHTPFPAGKNWTPPGKCWTPLWNPEIKPLINNWTPDKKHVRAVFWQSGPTPPPPPLTKIPRSMHAMRVFPRCECHSVGLFMYCSSSQKSQQMPTDHEPLLFYFQKVKIFQNPVNQKLIICLVLFTLKPSR